MKGIEFSNMRNFAAGNVKSGDKSREMSNGESFLQVFDKTQGQSQEVSSSEVKAPAKDTDSIQKHSNMLFSKQIRE